MAGLNPFSPALLASLVLAAATSLPPARHAPLPEDEMTDQPIGTDFSDYIWPTDAGSIITSTFAEYRRMHFHGGIDISTGNDTGFLVFASRDGYVSRIRVNPDGYGKMLFVRHADGFYSTYAHLRNFSSEIDERVRAEQYKNESYIVDIECTPLEFPVRKGDVIAYTGETGVGSPHLHFEIRDSNSDFVNPLLCDSFPNSDRIYPTIRRIALRPLGGGSTINGTGDVQLFNVHRKKQGVYEVREKIHVTGDAGFEIYLRDQSEGSYYRQGIYSHELFVDDLPFFQVRLDRAPSGQAHQSGMFYDWNLIDAGRGRFRRLFIDSPNDLHFYSPRGDSSGIINLAHFSEGPHTFRILSLDRGGNRAQVSGTFVLHRPIRANITTNNDTLLVSFLPPDQVQRAYVSTRTWKSAKWSAKTFSNINGLLELPSSGFDILRVVAEDTWEGRSAPVFFFGSPLPSGKGELTLTHDLEPGFLRFHIRSEQPITSTPVLKLYEGARERTIPVQAIDLDHWMGTVVPDDAIGGLRRAVVKARVNLDSTVTFDEFELYPVHKGGSGTYIIDDGNLVLSFDSTSVLKTTYIRVQKGEYNGSLMYELQPSNTVLNRGIIVAVRNQTPGTAGLFLHSRKGWDLLATASTPGNGMLSGRVRQTLGEVGIVADSIPPSVSRLRITFRRRSRPTISFSFQDNFAGVEYRGLKMYIDDTVAIPEIDNEHRRATFTATEPLEKGPHLLTIHIQDKLGNLREVKKEFRVQ